MHSPTKLGSWLPATSAQLAAVEDIATKHSGTAHVAVVDDTRIDVVSGQNRYVLDANGNVLEHEERRFLNINREEARAWFDVTTRVVDGG